MKDSKIFEALGLGLVIGGVAGVLFFGFVAAVSGLYLLQDLLQWK